MEIKEALELSAQCWCDPRTENRTMDEQLATVFAEVLAEQTSVKSAREIISQAFKDDPDFRETYVANIAMFLHDHHGITDHETRNKAGDGLVRLIFET